MSVAKDVGTKKPRWGTWLIGGILKGFLVVALLAGGLLLVRWFLFSGPHLPVESLSDTPIFDLHCHTAGIGVGTGGEGDSGCFVSAKLRHSYKFRIYLNAFGVTLGELQAQGDSLLVDKIAGMLSESERVNGAVLLALDGVVTEDGELDRERTEIYVPNEFVADQVRRHTNLWMGASIHPYRKDALTRLDWAATNGAVLVKWIPSIMHVDPSDARLTAFYERMIYWDLPLLTHTGQERSFTSAKDELSDPDKLRLPLELGVQVIAAHVASTGMNEGERDMDRLERMMRVYPNLYADISSLTQVNKLGYLKEVLQNKEFEGRLLYGSDFPLINTALVSPWLHPLHLTRTQMQELSDVKNPWDRDVALKQALGVPKGVFTRYQHVLDRWSFGPSGKGAEGL